MSTFNLVFLDAATFGDTSLERFSTTWTCSVAELTGAKEVSERLAGQRCAIVNKFVLDRKILLSPATQELQLIAVAATGTNNVDIDCARSRGIAVCNVPSYATYSVAQFTISLVFEMATRAVGHALGVRAGRWQESPIFTRHDYPTFDLHHKVLGVIGYGSIGRKVAEMARALGMEVLVAARLGDQPGSNDPRVSFEDVLSQADFVTLHCPLTPGTTQLIDRHTLALMKPTAFLINTARGGLIDELALIEALEKNQLAGAALDVISQEPPSPDHSIIEAASRLENLWVTPHCAWATHEARHRLLGEVFHNIAAFQRGERRNRLD